MATRTKKNTTTIPTFGQLEKQVTSIRKDIERTVDRVTREAARYIPETSRRQIGDLYDRVTDIFGDNAKIVTKKVEEVRDEVEDTVEDLRGTVDKRVKTIRKDAAKSSKKAFASLETLEKEARKQVERVLGVIGVPVRGDLDNIKRRISALERKINALAETTKRKRASSAA